ncbi:hypothetical protein GCM10020221_24710 [Streptomyces thioluteus]|uniref:Threonine/Serine exporter ThrE domain-containing protein n=1 Tax=Streptomyces thioluteus TaxID=66431 RepID=A0ABN3WW70_STRTU
MPATAIAAGLVGLFGQLLSRYQYTSALPYVTAAIGPLLPGSAVYFALLNFAKNEMNTGMASLSRAAALALAIAIGVNLGSETARMFLVVPGGAGPARGEADARFSSSCASGASGASHRASAPHGPAQWCEPPAASRRL